MQIIQLIQYTSVVTAAFMVSTAQVTTAAPCVNLEMVGASGNPMNPPAIIDGDIGTVFVTLDPTYAANPPSAVEISAPGLQFGRTKFKFDKNDRTSFKQPVTVRTNLGSARDLDGQDVTVPVTMTYTDGPVASETHNFKRRVVSSASCHGYGDPHLTTLDGMAYNFQTQGVFRLFESNNLQVQIFQKECVRVGSGVSCYQGVAVAFGSSIVRFFGGGPQIQVAKGSASLQWLSVEKLNAGGDAYRVFTTVDQATYVDVTANVNDYSFLNVALQVSAYFKNAQVSGLMGNWNANKNDDVTDNNQLAALYGVSLSNNLFTCIGAGCSPMLKPNTIKDSNAASVNAIQPLVHQGFVALEPGNIPLKAFQPVLKASRRRLDLAVDGSTTAGNTTSVPVKTDSTTAKTTTSTTTTTTVKTPVKKDLTEDATRLCNRVISSLRDCAKYVRNTREFIANVCVFDAVLLGDLSIVDAAKLAYLRECRREMDAQLQTKLTTKTETKTLVRARQDFLFGDVSHCTKNCSERGTCLAAGCKCDAGFTGLGCEISI